MHYTNFYCMPIHYNTYSYYSVRLRTNCVTQQLLQTLADAPRRLHMLSKLSCCLLCLDWTRNDTLVPCQIFLFHTRELSFIELTLADNLGLTTEIPCWWKIHTEPIQYGLYINPLQVVVRRSYPVNQANPHTACHYITLATRILFGVSIAISQ